MCEFEKVFNTNGLPSCESRGVEFSYLVADLFEEYLRVLLHT